MNYYGQLPWLLWFAWFYSWYLVIKRFIFNCKVRSIKEKTSQRKAGKSSSVFKLWRVFQEVCFEQLTSYADLTQTHLHSVGDSAVSKTEKTPVCKASAGFQGQWQRAEGLGDDQLQTAWSPALPTEGQTGRPLSSAYTPWYPVTTGDTLIPVRLFLLGSLPPHAVPAASFRFLHPWNAAALPHCSAQHSALFFLYLPSETLLTATGSTTTSKLLTPKSLFLLLAPLSAKDIYYLPDFIFYSQMLCHLKLRMLQIELRSNQLLSQSLFLS